MSRKMLIFNSLGLQNGQHLIRAKYKILKAIAT